MAAASLDKPTTVQLLVHRFTQLIEDQRGLSASGMLEGLTGETFRSLRRLGMKNEAERVLFQIHASLTHGEDLDRLRNHRPAEWPTLIRTLLHVAAGWYYCGRTEEGHAIIEEVRKDLYQRSMPLAERTALVLAYCSTLGHVDVGTALGRFEELFLRLKKISIHGWNSHYTLQPLQLIDTVIRAVVSEDFTLGPAIRGWLDDDEFRVRQRINDDLRQMMDEQGIA